MASHQNFNIKINESTKNQAFVILKYSKNYKYQDDIFLAIYHYKIEIFMEIFVVEMQMDNFVQMVFLLTRILG